MPQVTCPNCGLTINLENRKEIDLELIKQAAQKGPTTFTELLHITKLPRKTLSIRLKELLENGTLIKAEGTYILNGNVEYRSNGGHFMKGFSRALNDKRIRTGIMLAALLICSGTTGYVMALFLATPEQSFEPQPKPILGSFTLALDVHDVQDLWAWQAIISFNETELKVQDISPGGFLGVDYPLFNSATDVGPGVMFIGGSLSGDTAGKNGAGTLATIVFGYYVENYKDPQIVYGNEGFITSLWDSNLANIPIETQTLTLTPAS